MDSATRRLAAVWFADIVGYTGLSSRDEAKALQLVELLQEIAREQTEQRGGTVVKFVGDAVLAHAPSAASAVETVLSLRQHFEEESERLVQPSYLRIGVHLGDVVISADGDVYGDGVNIASRLQAAAEPGRILVSEDVWRQCRQRPELELVSIGPRHFKGLDEQVWIYELSPPDTVAPEVRAPISDLGTDRSLAVLPFEVLGAGDEAGFLASGIHNDLLTELSKVPGLTVISRTSVMGYRGTDKPTSRIAHELNVGTVVEGTLQSAGSRVRLTVQLIDGKTDVHRWADYFDREVTTESLFEIQTELTERIVDSLHAELGPRAADEAGRATASIEAYRLVVEGRMQFDRKTEGGFGRAIELFEEAVEIDPGYGMAWAGLADSLALMADYGYGDREALIDRASAAAHKAAELLPSAAAPHTSLGLIAEVRHDAPTALREYELTIKLDPNQADAHSWHAWVSLVVGRGEQALASATRSVELNPLSAEAVTNLALSHLAVGDPERALAEAKRAGELSPGYTTAAYYEGLALYDLGRYDDAVAVLTPLASAVTGELTTPWASMAPDAALALAQIAADRREDALRTLGTIDAGEYPFEAGIGHAGLGDVEEALAHFSRVVTVSFGPALLFHHHFRDVWAGLQDSPRLAELEGKVYRTWSMKAP